VGQACRDRGIKTVAVSAGYISPEPRVEFFRHMDAANIDLKGFTEGFYKNLCTGKLAPVLETLEYLKHETNVWFEITTLLIPGENDSAAEIEAESAWVMDRLGPDVPLHLTAFHPDWKLMDSPPTPPQTLRAARRIAMNAGLRYVYTGNIHDPAGQSTHCHGCGALLIGRDWYDITAWHLAEDGRCVACGTRCHGVFEAIAGRWGRRRQPLQLRASEPVPVTLYFSHRTLWVLKFAADRKHENPARACRRLAARLQIRTRPVRDGAGEGVLVLGDSGPEHCTHR
ncbi:MAG: AmmeMemoRadiSam system radical SAM enzyme, partial [Pseudolabrys sp.]